MANDYTTYRGRVTPGFQLASGLAVKRPELSSPFPDSTLRMQHPHFLARGFDMTAHVPGLIWATINVRLDNHVELLLSYPDHTLELVDWTKDSGGPEIAPETFSFTYCCLAHAGRYYSALLYYPDPATKPTTNAHDYGVLEVLATQVDGLRYDDPVTIMCRANAFVPR